MGVLRAFILLFAVFALVSAKPGFFKHEHHTIHVPYKVHTIHHHHVKKIPIYKEIEVPVIKHVPIYKEVIKEVPVIKEVHVPVHVHHEKHHDHHDHHEHHDHHDWSSSGWD